jgi:hypothetical protein
MTAMPRKLALLSALAFLVGPALAEAPPAEAPATPDAEGWSFAASAFYYFVPDDDDFVLPIVAVDRGPLHLEARYNYEARDTASVWAGYNFSGGKNVEWEVTPILGGVFGDTDGWAPGYEFSLAWKKLELYSEGEYVFDTGDSSESFFYNWSELSFSPVEWFRFGLVTQRTRAYETERDIQRGLLLGFSIRKVDATVYVFNPDDSDPLVVAAVAVEF